MINNESKSNNLYQTLNLNEKDLNLFNSSIGIISIVDSNLTNSFSTTATGSGSGKSSSSGNGNLQISQRTYGENKLKLSIDTNTLKIIQSNDSTCITDIDIDSIKKSNSFDYILEETNKNHQITKTILKSINFLLNNYPTTYNNYNNKSNNNILNINFNDNHGYLSSYTTTTSGHGEGEQQEYKNNSNYKLIELFINKSKEYGNSSQVIEYQLSVIYSVAIMYWLMVHSEIVNCEKTAANELIQRIALHKLTGYILSMTEQDYLCFIKALQISNGILDTDSLFFDYIQEIKKINSTNSSLFEKLKLSTNLNTIELQDWCTNGGGNGNGNGNGNNQSSLSNELIENVIEKRDSRVSWYLKSCKLDYCYDRQSFKKALEIEDVEQRREATFQVIKKYNQEIEQRNSIYLSNEIRSSSSSKTIVCGRESRAFSNQATLFASSSIIQVSPNIKSIIEKIKKLISIDYFVSQFDNEIGRSSSSSSSSSTSIIEGIKIKLIGQLKHLMATSGRFQILHSKKQVSITQIQGAIVQLKETLSIVYGKCYSIIDQENSNSLLFQAEGCTRTYSNNGSSTRYDTIVMIYKFIDGLYSRGHGEIWKQLNQLEQESMGSKKESSSFSVLLQRPSLSGSERFKTNDLEAKGEQERNLQKLVRIGGENIHMSPSNCWVEHCTDLIEAVPLFIYERTHIVDCPDSPGSTKSETIFEVDQEGLEQTIRSLSDPFSKNIKITMLSEHLSLARELLIHSNDKLSEQSKLIQQQHGQDQDIESIYIELLSNRKDDIVKLSIILEQQYNSVADQVENNIEQDWKESKFSTRIDSFRELIFKQQSSFKELIDKSKHVNLDTVENRIELEYYSLLKQRSLPAIHLLTTEATGLCDSFIQAVFEEEMCLNNIIQHYKLESKVVQLLSHYSNTLELIGKKVIDEFNYQPIVEQRMNQLKVSQSRAISSILSDHPIIQNQVSILCVLYELDSISDTTSTSTSLSEQIKFEPNGVIKILNDPLHYNQFEYNAINYIYNENKNEVEFKSVSSLEESFDEISNIIKTVEPYKNEFKYFIGWEARNCLVDQLNLKSPELYIKSRIDKYFRNHTSLSLTTARRTVISECSLYNQLNNPLFAYTSGSTVTIDGETRPTGMRKRYNFIYGPSRVNLGKDERRSVEIWPQFVGVADSLAAKHAFNFYSLINHNPIVRTITGAENLKVSENQNTALIRSVRNVQALFVERLSVGDIEDLAYQFNQRGGISIASSKEGESFSSGPTAGYCIPKDLLFKLFIVTHQDQRKLSMIGIPKHLHSTIIQLMVEISNKQWQFNSTGEWENWAVNQLTDDTIVNNSEISEYTRKYIKITGGVVVFHISKLIQILGTVGIPSPLIGSGGSNSGNNTSSGKELNSTMWSCWAEKKITLGGEQVNRSVVFPMTVEIPQSGQLAKKLNPMIADKLPSISQLRVHFFGVYKGDDDEKPPPDVRFAWVMRAFQIISGHYKEVALSLDQEGQLIARLTWCGFKPNSTDIEDQMIRKYLAQQFLGVNDFNEKHNRSHQELIDKLVEKFPCYQGCTVGDITITSVPGVSSEDLLGFSAETLTLLGDDATDACEILKTKGISLDQMKANAILHREFIDEWVPLSNLPKAERDAIKLEIGGRIHPLILRLRGPGNQFLRDLQGQDIVVFSITHPQLLSLDPAMLRDLMLIGRPNSSLIAHDHVSQGRHRVWFERDIMIWYAACLGIDGNGNRINNWNDRKQHGRKSIYKAFGFGKDQYQPILGTDLRQEVYRQEYRSIKSFELFEQIYNCDDHDSNQISTLINQLSQLLFGNGNSNSNGLLSSLGVEIELLTQYEQRVLLANRSKKRDFIIRELLQYLYDNQSVEAITPLHWLSIGGYLLLNGTTLNYQNRILKIIQLSYEKINNHINNNKNTSLSKLTDSNVIESIKCLITVQLAPSKIQLKDRKGKMFSVKASEEHVESGITRRKELLLQSKKNQILKSRSNGYNTKSDTIDNHHHNSIESIRNSIISQIHDNISKLNQFLSSGGSSGDLSNINFIVGKIFKLSIYALQSIVNLIYGGNENEEKQNLSNTINSLCLNGNEIDLKVWDQLVGTYESFGMITPIYQISNDKFSQDDHTSVIESVSELLSTLMLFEKVSLYLSLDIGNSEYNDQMIWRSLAEFFAKTIDDHYSEYTPWTLDPKRYSIFSRHFDQVGIMLAGERESQYSIYWNSHRSLYQFIRLIIEKKTTIHKQVSSIDEFDLLFGKTLVSTSSSGNDLIQVRAIGAGAPSGSIELLWRSYNQLREITFIKNDGFQLPRVFSNLVDPYLVNTLDCSNKVNHCFLSPVGRTHYASALTEGPTLQDNLFITRDGQFINENGIDDDNNNGSVGHGQSILTISDAFYWISIEQYKFYLSSYLKLSNDQIESKVILEREEKIIIDKGVLVASRFLHPIVIGSIVTLHHHRLENKICNSGYPTTDKSPFLYEMTYNKSLYPLIFNNSDSGVHLPQEIDWLQIETTNHLQSSSSNGNGGSHQELIKMIESRLLPFIQKYPIIIVKGAAESGARNLSRFDLQLDQSNDNDYEEEGIINDQDSPSSSSSGSIKICKKSLTAACEFILHISKSQNVVIQRAIISSPLFWMSNSAIQHMVKRQIQDYGVALELNRFPKDSIYGSLRIILSSGNSSKSGDNNNSSGSMNLDNIDNWTPSHPITLNSTQIATNVGRQGSLEILNSSIIRKSLQSTFIKELELAGKNVMSSISKFGPVYWDKQIELYQQSFKSYHERFPLINQYDSLGTPIWWPRYLMLDFIPEPVWCVKGKPDQIIESCRIIDISIPPTSSSTSNNDEDDENSCIYLLKDLKSGIEFQGEIVSIKFWHLEPNVGIGLWTNYWKREIELHSSNNTTGNCDWSKIGSNDRIIISNFLKIGKQFISTINPNLLKTISNINNYQSYQPSVQHQSPTSTQSTASNNNSSEIANNLNNTINNNNSLSSLKDDPIKFLNDSILICNEYCLENEIDIQDRYFVTRVVERNLDLKISQLLTPSDVEILMDDCDGELIGKLICKYLKHSNTFSVITGKTTLMNHHFYPFFSSHSSKISTLFNCDEKFPINVIGCYKDWVALGMDGKSINIKRCQLLTDENKIMEFNIPENLNIKLSTCFILELESDHFEQEISLHKQLQKEFSSCNVVVMNDFHTSNSKCDDKLWLKSSLSKWFTNGEIKSTLPHVLLKLDQILNERDILISIEKQSPELMLLDLSSNFNNFEKGLILQPRSNTTESQGVDYFRSPTSFKKLISKVIEMIDGSEDQLINEEYGNEFIISQFIDSVKTKSDGCRILIRLNACIGNEITISIVKAGSNDETIISPGKRGSKWVLVSEILSDLPIPIKKKDWLLWCEIAQSIQEEIELPIIGIDMILCYDSLNQQYIPFILEANARPGSLIMAEKLHFNSTTGELDHTTLTSPISFSWWCQSIRNCHLSINEILKMLSIDLLKDRYSYSGDGSIVDPNKFKKEIELLNERKLVLTELLENSIKNHSFNPFSTVVLVASNGRDRIFMGHSDLLGLGGFTINSNTMNEILCCAQLIKSDCNHPPGTITLTNENKQFKNVQFSIDTDVIEVLNASISSKSQDPLWNSVEWENYIKCLFAYLIYISDQYPVETVQQDLKQLRANGNALIFHFSNNGLLSLPTSGGVSSSSALTGATILALNSLFKWSLSKEQMANTDFGEYFLGKSAGASDKTTQLFSKKGKISIIGSLPERFIKSLKFPNKLILVLICESNIPRLTTLSGRQWIIDSIENKTIVNNSVDVIFHWSQQIMKSFGSAVLIDSIEILKDKLSNPFQLESTIKITQFTDIEMKKLYICICKNNLLRDLSGCMEVDQGGTSSEILKLFPEFKNNRLKRYLVIYKLLLLLPETKLDKFGSIEYYNRKSVLFALSELERGIVYQQIISFLSMDSNGSGGASISKVQKKQLVSDLMKIIKTAHNGDRQIQDYRDGFKPTKWSTDQNNCFDDSTIQNWITETEKLILPIDSGLNLLNQSSSSSMVVSSSQQSISPLSFDSIKNSSSNINIKSSLSLSKEFGIADKFNSFYYLHNSNTHSVELSLKCGGFQRSLPDFDEIADQLDQQFNGKAALRVSAAGLGGSVCVHVVAKKFNDVKNWLSSKNFNIRKINTPGPSSESLFQ